jgi:hypothetical protein
VITDIEQACDHLIVLVAGAPLLAGVHRRSDRRPLVIDLPGGSAAAGGRLVGSFPAPRRVAADARRGSVGRPARLEEVVIGHLAAGRSPRVVSVAREEAA